MKATHSVLARVTTWAIPLAIGLLALATRTINLENWPRWYTDEGVAGQAGLNLLQGIWGDRIWGPSFSAPLFGPLTTGLMSALLGPSYFAIRLPTALLGSISCVLLYLIGTRLYNRFVGIAAALILAVASVHINRMALNDNGVEFFFLLAVFFYLKGRDDERQRWNYLMGVSVGLAFLFKYTGIAVPLFIIFQSLLDGRFFKVWRSLPVFALVALISPLIGLIVDWDSFVWFTLEVGSRPPNFARLLNIFLFAHYGSRTSPAFYYNIWATLGFILLFYRMARNHPGDRLLLAWAGAYLVAMVYYGTGFWVYVVELYPIYSLAIATTLYDIWQGRDRFALVGAFVLLLMLPAFSGQGDIENALLGTVPPLLYPSLGASWGQYLFYAVFAAILLALLGRQPQFFEKTGARILTTVSGSRFLNGLILLPPVIVILLGSAYELRPIFVTNDAADQAAVVEWLNANTKEGDLVAAEREIVYPLKTATGIAYDNVILYTTRRGFHHYYEELLPRFRMDASLWKIDYFVVDSNLYSVDEAGDGGYIGSTVTTLWIPQFEVGDYQVYKNPGYTASNTWLTNGVPGTSAEGSQVIVGDNGELELTLASATGDNAEVWFRTPGPYDLPLDIRINHTLPTPGASKQRYYLVALVTKESDTTFFNMSINDTNNLLEVGTLKSGKWTRLAARRRDVLQGPTEWRITVDSEHLIFYENGSELLRVPNQLTQASFYLRLAQNTADDTLKTWKIHRVQITSPR